MKDSDNRYYIPEITEFHLGFEYEVTNGYDWVIKEFKIEDLKSFLYDKLQNAITLNFIRVKHLDRDDIVSLGFVQEDLDTYKLGKFYFELDNEYKNHIYQKEHALKDRILFAGKIKNKSELKRLLKQLEIL